MDYLCTPGGNSGDEFLRTPLWRTSENSPSTHSGELTLGTWLLQQPTHRDHGPTEHRHRRIHPSSTSEGPEVLPVLTSHQASSPSRAPSPYPLLPLSPGYPLSYLLVYPTNPTMVAVFGVSKGFVTVGF